MKNIIVLDIEGKPFTEVKKELGLREINHNDIYICLITNVKMEIEYYIEMDVKKIFIKSIGDKYILVSWTSLTDAILYNKYYDDYIEFLAPLSLDNNPKSRTEIINFDLSDIHINNIDDLKSYSESVGIKYESIIYAPVDTDSNYIINWNELIKLGVSNLYVEKVVHCENYIMIAWKDTRGIVINSEGYTSYLESIDKFLKKEAEILEELGKKEVKYLDRLGDMSMFDNSHIEITKANQEDVDYLIDKIREFGMTSLDVRELLFLERISNK